MFIVVTDKNKAADPHFQYVPVTSPDLKITYTSKKFDDSKCCRVGYGDNELLVGAWCIGTVMDSAASRSTLHVGSKSFARSMVCNAITTVHVGRLVFAPSEYLCLASIRQLISMLTSSGGQPKKWHNVIAQSIALGQLNYLD